MVTKEHIPTLIRSATALMIIFSIFVTFYVIVIQRDYHIETYPDGPDTSDYFEELGIIE